MFCAITLLLGSRSKYGIMDQESDLTDSGKLLTVAAQCWNFTSFSLSNGFGETIP
jgi:hypothetical protein